jgi:hypothetical protein
MAEAEVRCHVVVVHAHVRRMFSICRAVAPQRLYYAPSAINSFAPLDTCNGPVEYDVREDICIYQG